MKSKTSKIKTLPVIGISTLGCPKNLVDTENMIGILHAAGYQITTDHTKADISLVNTCTFIKESNNESKEVLNTLNKLGKKTIVAGCLAQRFKEKLFDEFPNTKALIGTGNIKDILNVIKIVTKNLNNGKDPRIVKIDGIVETPQQGVSTSVTPRSLTQIGPSAYLKIAEGCNHTCSFCIIPYLRGKMRSRPIEDIVTEAKTLVQNGIKEIVLVSQDSTAYGTDLYKKKALADLLETLADNCGAKWIRLMYAYPQELTEEMLNVIKEKENIVKYIDIPLQHASKKILRAMLRPLQVKNTVKLIRKIIPDCTIRTTFIVGFPGEQEEDFNELYEFIKEARFDRVGVFTYSREKGTAAYEFENQVPHEIKQKRKDKLMRLQQKISLEKNKEFIGKTMDMLVEYIEHNVETRHGASLKRIVGRSYRDAPEIDGQLYIDLKPNEKNPLPGEFIKVKITGCDEYDLYCK